MNKYVFMEDDVRLNFDDLLDDVPSNDSTEVSENTPQNLYEPQRWDDDDDSDEGDEDKTEEHDGDKEPDYSSNSVYSFLQSRGISDPSRIKFENEDGSVEEVDFNSLSPEEQLEIFSQVTDPGLSEDEIATVNYLRRNRMSMGQIMNIYAQQYLDNYLKEHPEDVRKKEYTVDDYSDDDLYVIDLKNRYPDFSDDEILSKLEEAKNNESLYKRETEILRNTFKQQEDQAEAAKLQQEQQQIQDLRTNLMNAAKNFNEIQLDYTDDESDSLVIEDSDKPQMISYILDQDSDGKSQLVKDLENPDTLIELAWLRTQGAQVLSNLTQYWKGELANERAENKKLRAQLDRINKKYGSTVVVPKPSNSKKNNDTDYSVWDNSGLI